METEESVYNVITLVPDIKKASMFASRQSHICENTKEHNRANQEFLDGFLVNFKHLSLKQVKAFFKDLLANCSIEQRLCIQEFLPRFLIYDFITLLPAELSEYILHYLDASTLMSCRKVSKSWNTIILNAWKLWWQHIWLIGGSVESLKGICKTDYFSTYCQLKRIFNKLNTGKAFSQKIIGEEFKKPGLVYRDHIVAVGTSDPGTALLNSQTGDILHKWKGCMPSCISIGCDFIVAGTFVARGWVWSLHDFSFQCELEGHTNAILCVDIHPNQTFVLTASADKSVRLHNLQDGSSQGFHFDVSYTVQHVRFLPYKETGAFIVLVGGQLGLLVAKITGNGHIMSVEHLVLHLQKCLHITHATYNKELLFLSLWCETDPYQSFCCIKKYRVDESGFRDEETLEDKSSHMKYVVEAGKRFLLLVSNMSRISFCIFDLLTRNTLCVVPLPAEGFFDRLIGFCGGECGWLDGLCPSLVTAGQPVFLCIDSNGALNSFSWSSELWSDVPCNNIIK